jgi:hypothetical protein
VGQRDQVEGAAIAVQRERAPNNFVEFLERKELGDGELADGNNERRSKNIDFITHPGRTIPDLVWCGDAVAAGWGFSWKASTDRREIKVRADLFFT